MSKKEGNIEKYLSKYLYLIFFLGGMTILLTFFAYLINGYINNGKLATEKLGHFGDFIGGLVGVELTFIATLLIYYTYKSQKEELKLSRELFSKQNFENTFFNMLNVHRELRKEIGISPYIDGIFPNYLKKGEIATGKSFFKFAEDEFKNLWKFECNDSMGVSIMDNISQKHINYGYKHEITGKLKISDSEGNIIENSIRKHFKDITILKYPLFWEEYANYLGDYFRNTYHILKYISNEKFREKKEVVDETEKEIINQKYKKYADILQSQMSYSELFFIFYNALSYSKMRKLIKEFDFVENLTIKNLLHPKHAQFKSMGNIKDDY